MTSKTNAKPSDFFTRTRANDGARIPLVTPEGEITDQWIEVYGVDSDAFREADALARREGSRIALIKDDEERDKAVAELTRVMRASLIKAWSFEMPLTKDAALEFIREAPQVGDALDKIVSDRSLFFTLASKPSTNSLATNTTSTPRQKAPVKAAGKASSKSQSKQE